MELPQQTVDMVKSRGLAWEHIVERHQSFSIDIGDWCMGNPTNRFRNTPTSKGASNTAEKLADIGAIKKHTGLIKGITANAFGILNDFSLSELDRYRELLAANDLSVTSVQPNSTKDIRFLNGSITNPDTAVRDVFMAHVAQSIRIAEEVGAGVLTLWFGDGSNYPGSAILQRRITDTLQGLQTIYGLTPPAMDIHLEYKHFEPATYHSDVADWGTALLLAQACGERMKVLIDTGHHPLGTNVEYIVALLASQARMGSVHINSKKYADDDLNSGAINPYELFLVMKEMVYAAQVGLQPLPTITLDEFHHTKPPLLGVLQSILYLEKLFLKALLINWDFLEGAIAEQDFARAENHLHEAFLADVSPFIDKIRRERGLSPDSFHSMYETEYYRKVIANR